MPTDAKIKLPLTSRDINAERFAQLRQLFPEAFTEGKLDLKKFPSLLGDAVSDAPERYGLSWSGKSDAIKAIQTLTSATLLPCPTESCPPLPFAGEPEGRVRHSVRAAARTTEDGALGTDAPTKPRLI